MMRIFELKTQPGVQALKVGDVDQKELARRVLASIETVEASDSYCNKVRELTGLEPLRHESPAVVAARQRLRGDLETYLKGGAYAPAFLDCLHTDYCKLASWAIRDARTYRCLVWFLTRLLRLRLPLAEPSGDAIGVDTLLMASLAAIAVWRALTAI
jgi:hypothetical protein